jgi:hypothetical protein
VFQSFCADLIPSKCKWIPKHVASVIRKRVCYCCVYGMKRTQYSNFRQQAKRSLVSSSTVLLYRVSQKLLCTGIYGSSRSIALQAAAAQHTHQWRSGEVCPDVSSGPWGTFATSALGRPGTWYVVLYCTELLGHSVLFVLQWRHQQKERSRHSFFFFSLISCPLAF